MSAHLWQATLAAAVVSASPLLFASTGEMVCEKVGVGNWGIEGVMLMGAVLGYIGAANTDSVLLGVLLGGAGAAAFTLVVFAIPVLSVRANPILIAFATWFIGQGVSSQIGGSYQSRPLHVALGTVNIPLLKEIPFVGPILFEQAWTVYAAVVILLIVSFGLSRTAHGLNMRALGEDPASAYASGIRVLPWRALYLCVGGALIGIGGAVLSVVITHGWQSGMTAGRGWISWALVIFVGWRPLRLLAATFLFGLLLNLATLGQAQGWPIPSPFLTMAPYVLTIAALAAQTARERLRGGGASAPAALGADFYRGSR